MNWKDQPRNFSFAQVHSSKQSVLLHRCLQQKLVRGSLTKECVGYLQSYYVKNPNGIVIVGWSGRLCSRNKLHKGSIHSRLFRIHSGVNSSSWACIHMLCWNYSTHSKFLLAYTCSRRVCMQCAYTSDQATLKPESDRLVVSTQRCGSCWR